MSNTAHEKTGSRYLARTIKQTLSLAMSNPSKRKALPFAWAVGMTFAAPFAMPQSAWAVDLPVPCRDGGCGRDVANRVVTDFDDRLATTVTSGNTLNVNQSANHAVLNWKSFNISSDATVNFNQPNASSVAINRIFDANVSRITGALNANGRVYLLNQNGILFGQGASINVGGMVASSLDIIPEAIENGLLKGGANTPVFRLYTDKDSNPLVSGAVRIDPGANLRTAEGGEILIFAPEITNRGNISTPGGQTILAAGQSIILTSGSLSEVDPLRGLLVEVAVGGTVTNGEDANRDRNIGALVGNILAERGNVTLAGLAVNQLGRVSATTSVRANGTIRLTANPSAANPNIPAAEQGHVVLGERSVTDIALDASGGTTVDANVQDRSNIWVQGKQVELLANSQVVAQGGDITLAASRTRIDPTDPGSALVAEPDDSRIYIGAGARVDVSGANTELAMERNSLRVELRGSQLADSPNQRNSALRGETVYVDVRATGTRADGTTWVGSPIGDLAGDISTLERDVFERNTLGGSILLASQGDVIVAPTATLDLSGGSVTFRDGVVAVSQLTGVDGRVYDMSQADRDRQYFGLGSGYTVTDRRWGVTRSYFGAKSPAVRHFEAGYVEGKDAGTLSIIAPRAILDGDVKAQTPVGRYQRQATTELKANELFRAYNQVPLGGQLILGDTKAPLGVEQRDFVVGAVSFASGLVLPTLTNDDNTIFNPRIDALPDSFNQIRLRPELVNGGDIAGMTVFANNSISLPESTSLHFAPGGAVNWTSAHIDVRGDITIPSGTMNLVAATNQFTNGLDPNNLPTLTIGSDSSLSTAGLWINDSRALNPLGATAPLWIDGGTISLSAREGSLNLETGSILDVSGGAWLRTNGSVVGGRGGSISLTATALAHSTRTAPFFLGADLRGYALTNGGSLSISANEICIAEQACNNAASTVWLRPEFFQSGGFGSYQLTANFRGLTVAPGTQMRLRQDNLVLNTDVASRATGYDFAAMTRIALLADEFRSATNLGLTTRIDSGSDPVGIDDSRFATAPNLVIGSGAEILADPGARIDLASNSRLIVDGAIRAPGGTINLKLNNTLAASTFLSSQSIWLGSDATLDVHGVAKLSTDALGRTTGEVLNGGSVNITADRGYVIATQGSTIDVSGTSAAVDLRASGSAFVSRTVSSSGGALNIKAAEGAFLSGTIAAGGGAADSYGGSFALVLDNFTRSYVPDINAGAPNGDRIISVETNAAPITIAPGISVPLSLNGRSLISTNQLAAAGFDSVSLTARSTQADSGGQPNTNSLGGFGVIALADGVNFSTRARLTLDAPVLRLAQDAEVTLGSSYLAISNLGTINGNGLNFGQMTPAVLSDHGATLNLHGKNIDVIGNVAVDGAHTVRLESTGDLRLRGLIDDTHPRYYGSLNVAVDIELQAAQIYPATFTDFSIQTYGPTGSIRTFAGPSTTQPVLSAAGNLRLVAPTIELGGTIRAPFGTIDLIASDALTLLPGSITSTSPTTIIPFGTTQGGFDWAYDTARKTFVFGDGSTPIPEQSVRLTANAIDFQQGATINVSAGGDLQAYEWIKGVGGTHDVLSASERPNQYAVIPGINFAPYDGSADYQNSTLAAGASVYLSGAPGLPAGFYTLLPARYALLPGAFLVTPNAGYRDIVAGQSYARPNGSTVVSGYYSIAGTNIRDSRTQGFAVRAGSDVQREAQYNLSFGSQFLAERTLALDIQRPRLANDAGRVAFNAVSQLNIGGSLLATALEQGRGAAVDISSARLRLVDDGSPSSNGFVNVDVTQLAQLNAESIFIGGFRDTELGGTRLTVSAEQVEVANGVEMTAPELLLGAHQSVVINDGAMIHAQGAVAGSQDTLLLSGDSALLRVSTGNQVTVKRAANTAPGTTGVLDVHASAQLIASGGSVTADVSRDTLSMGQLAIEGGSLSIGASRISFGQTAQPVSGLLLDVAQFDTLGLNELVLNSRTSLDFYGAVNLNVAQLVVDSNGMRAADNAANVAITADRISLLNNNGAAVAAPTAGSGHLALSAQELDLGNGQFELSGFATAHLQAQEQIVAGKSGLLSTAGDLLLTTPRIVGGAGVTYATLAGGALNIAPLTPTTSAAVAPLGARLSFTGRSINHAGRIDAPSGIVELNATGASGDVVIASGATISVAGVASVFDGVTVDSPAGRIALSSGSGSVRTEAGSTLDAQASGGGSAGRVSMTASQGQIAVLGAVLGGAQDSAHSGEISLDAQNLGDLNALNASMTTGGFFASRTLRQRGSGDLILQSEWRAQHLDVTADQGAINVTGTVNGAGVEAGTAVFSARDAITIAGAINLAASGDGERGGRVEMRSTQGGVFLESSSTINVGAGVSIGPDAPALGTVHLSVGRAAGNTLLDADAQNDAVRLAGVISGARSVSIERNAQYTATDTAALSNVTGVAYTEASSFMENAATILANLGHGGDALYRVVPGVEIDSDSDLTVSSDWDLSQWRFGSDLPGVLTLRAKGNVLVGGSLSDGFQSIGGFTPFAQGRTSWSYRLIAGADSSSSNPFAVQSTAALAGSGNLIMSAGTPTAKRMIRTGTGSIEIATGGDVRLNSTADVNQNSVIYTAGTAGPGIVLNQRNNFGGFGIAGLQYPIGGGDIDIHAQGDIRGVRSNQLVTDWLWRAGSSAAVANPSSTAWTVNFQTFAQNIGALGGGNVSAEAGGDVIDLSVSIPSIGRQVGGRSPAQNQVEVVGGGDMFVRAGRSLQAGTFYLGKGEGVLLADDGIGQNLQSDALAPVLALGDARFTAIARNGLVIESAVNPTLLPQGTSQGVGAFTSYFSTYSTDAEVSLQSVAGSLSLGRSSDATPLTQQFNSMNLSDNQRRKLLQIYPSSLRASALSGDISVVSTSYLFPSAQGNLELFASGNVRFAPSDRNSDLIVSMSDADPRLLPNVSLPARLFTSTLTALTTPNDASFHAVVPVHTSTSDPDNADQRPVRIVARAGSVSMPAEFSLTRLYLPKATRVIAGTDITDLQLITQNTALTDVSTISAGRDIRYALARDTGTGKIQQTDREILVGGAGHLDIRAGRNVDLQTARGITTDGPTRNPALPDAGASISVIAGLAGRLPDVDAFTHQYFEVRTDYDAQLREFVETRTDRLGLTRAEVLTEFAALPDDQQMQFVETAFFTELRLSGRYAADADPKKHDDFSRGFLAMETLFPGSNPNIKQGQTNPYNGNIGLFFSRVYTIKGGDLNLLAPGGSVDVGLASPPASFGIAKAASELGVVAQQTGSINSFSYNGLQVNESRIFAADGGNILVWATAGDIDAGRGAKTAISAPPPVTVIDSNGQVTFEFPPALAGSGIQTLATSAGRKPGNVDLFAPRGVVNASDAGIVAGNLTIAATAVLGADNIKVSGVSVGVPVDAGGLGASLAGVSAAASSASNSATMDMANNAKEDAAAPISEQALSWLEVFVVGLGEENCGQNDMECLKRQK